MDENNTINFLRVNLSILKLSDTELKKKISNSKWSLLFFKENSPKIHFLSGYKLNYRNKWYCDNHRKYVIN